MPVRLGPRDPAARALRYRTGILPSLRIRGTAGQATPLHFAQDDDVRIPPARIASIADGFSNAEVSPSFSPR